jgi:putative heme-binding domain-containing protein
MKRAGAMVLVTGAVGAVALGWTFGDATPSPPSAAWDAPSARHAADASAKEESQEAIRSQSEDLGNANVPENLKGFERLVGSSERGTIVLSKRLSCLDCHSIVEGEDTGVPNLSDVGRRLGTKQIVTSILEPSRDFADGYKSIMAVTTDGRMIRGVELNSNHQVVVVRTSQGEEAVRRDQIEEMTVSSSDMPDGLVDDLTAQEFADLIAFLSGLGRSESLSRR